MIDFHSDSTWPYISTDLPGVGGMLRATPEHFVVDEVPVYEPSGEGQHLYVSITKVGLTTKEVQRSLAQLAQVDAGAIGFAGMKDKHARTRQIFSLPVGHAEESADEALCTRIADELPITVHWHKRHGNKLKAGHLLGNRFQITISDVAAPPSAEENADGDVDAPLAQARAIVNALGASGVPNYFGPQRFGLNGDNVAKGYDLLLGKKWIKDRWLRKFLVSSYQSYLCNVYLSRRVEDEHFSRLIEGDVAKKYETGGIFTVEDVEAEQPRYQDHEISFTAPMYGPKMRAAAGEAAQLEESILDASGITVNHLRKAKVSGTRRLGRLLLPDITVERSEQGLVVAFFLPKGAFATTVLREIMKVELSAVPSID